MLSKKIVNKIKTKQILSKKEVEDNLLDKTFFGQDILKLAIKYGNSEVFIEVLNNYNNKKDKSLLFGVMLDDLSQDILINLNEKAIKSYINLSISTVRAIYSKISVSYNSLENTMVYDNAISKIYGRLIEEGYKEESLLLLKELTKQDVVHNRILHSLLKVQLNTNVDDWVVNELLTIYDKRKSITPNKNFISADPEVLEISFVSVLLENLPSDVVKKMIAKYNLSTKLLSDSDDKTISKYPNKEWILNHPLYIAVKNKDYDFMMYLLDKGTDVALFNGSTTNYIWNTLISHKDAPKELINELLVLEHGIANASRDIEGRYASDKEDSVMSLLLSPSERNFKLFKNIFEYVFTKYFISLPNQENEMSAFVDNYSILQRVVKVAMVNNDLESLKYMIDKFSETSQYKNSLHTLFFGLAAEYGNVEVIKLLEGYDVSLYAGIWNREGESSKLKYTYSLMDSASDYRNYEVVKYLLNTANDKELITKKPFNYNEEYVGNFLIRALRSSSDNIDFINHVVDVYKERGLYIDENLTVDIYKQKQKSTYPLGPGFLVSSWDEKIVDGVFLSKINIDSKDSLGRGILYYIQEIKDSYLGDNKLNKLLNKYSVFDSCDKTNVDNLGNTPLHIQNVLTLDYIHLLLDFGVDYKVKNVEEKTVYDNLFNNTQRNLVFWKSAVSLSKLDLFFEKTSDIFLENYEVLKQSLAECHSVTNQDVAVEMYVSISDILEKHYLKATVNKPISKSKGVKV